MIQIDIDKKMVVQIPRKLISKAVNKINHNLKLRGRYAVTIVFVEDRLIQKLNKKYRRKNKVTDVLSFKDGEIEGKIEYLGEIFIAGNQAKRQARARGRGQQKEIVSLVIHGLLHLLGYDHIKQAEARKMKTMEQKILDEIYK